MAHVPLAVFNADVELFTIDGSCNLEDAPLSNGRLDGFLIECPVVAHVPRLPAADGLPRTDALRTLDHADALHTELTNSAEHLTVIRGGSEAAEAATTCRAPDIQAVGIPAWREAADGAGRRLTGRVPSCAYPLNPNVVVVGIDVQLATGWLADSCVSIDNSDLSNASYITDRAVFVDIGESHGRRTQVWAGTRARSAGRKGPRALRSRCGSSSPEARSSSTSTCPATRGLTSTPGLFRPPARRDRPTRSRSSTITQSAEHSGRPFTCCAVSSPSRGSPTLDPPGPNQCTLNP